MLAERERIEGIQQIEVAWSRVPGAESTGLHTEHTPQAEVPLLPSSTPSLFLALSRLLPSLVLVPRPSSLPYARRSLLYPRSFYSRSLSLIPLSSFLLPHRFSAGFPLPPSPTPSPPAAFSLSCRFPFRSLSRCYSEWRRSSRGNRRRCLPSSPATTTTTSFNCHPSCLAG